MSDFIHGLTSHHFEGRDVRTSFTASGDPLFVAKDVCDCLEITDYKQTLSNAPDWAKGGGVKHPTLGGSQEMATLTEAGVYWVALRSNKPNAERFQKWVCVELLPTLRREGSYSLVKPGLRRQIEVLKLRQRALELRAEAQVLEARARGETAVVTEIPEGYAATAEWVTARGLAEGHKSTQSVLALLTSRLRGRAESKLQRIPRERGYIKRRLWPVAALEAAARDAGLLNLEG